MKSKGVEQKASGTARGTAFMRAMASHEFTDEESLGSDTLAGVFLPLHIRILSRLAAKGSRVKKKIPPGLYEYMIARTLFFDQAFSQVLENGVSQIVLLGAGYDTRPYRLLRKGQKTRVFELDIASTQNRKLKCLKKGRIRVPENVKFASIDFNKESAEEVLAAHGYDDNLSALFIFEGVSYYLDPDSVHATMGLTAKNSNKKTVIAFDYVESPSPGDLSNAYGVEELMQSMAARHPGETGKFALEDGGLEAFLAKSGLKPVECLDNQSIEERFLIRKDGSSIGKITGWFRFATACRE